MKWTRPRDGRATPGRSRGSRLILPVRPAPAGQTLSGLGAAALVPLVSGAGSARAADTAERGEGSLFDPTAIASLDLVTAPTLFAAVSGAAAVAAILTAATLWRRLRATRETVRQARARIVADLSVEKVFVVEPGRLMPASPATERYLDAALRGQPAATPPADAAGARATVLREVFGPETAATLAPALRRLAEDGAPFVFTAPDAAGVLWRFSGETIGARGVMRLHPPGEATAAETPAGAATTAEPPADARAEALEHMPTGLLQFDGSGRLSYANAGARRLLRLEADWGASRPSLRALLDHLRETGRMPERPDHAEWRARAIADPAAAFAEDSVWRLPGGETLRVTARSLQDADPSEAPSAPGGPFVLYIADETDAREMDRRYKIAMGARRATIAAIDEGLAVIDPDGRLQLLNPAFVAMWRLENAVPADGLLEHSLGGPIALRDIAATAASGPADRALWEQICDAAAAPGPRARQRREFTAQRDDGAIIATRITPLPDGATLVSCADVSAAQQAERALREKAEALEAADRLKTEFLNDIAYRLRTPLNAVIGFSDMLRQGMAGPLDKRQQEYVGYVLDAANDLRELIADTLSLGALSADAPNPGDAAQRHDLRALGQSVTALLTKRAARRGAELSVALGPHPLAVAGDEARLRQAIFSAGTAVLACAASGDTVRIAIAEASPDGETGARRARLEARLSRRHELGGPAANPDSAAGLSLARRIVQVHGGRGAFEETTRGAVAVLEFPLLDEPPASAPPPENKDAA